MSVSQTKSKYYKVTEVAKLICISPKTIYGLIKEGKLPATKIGGSVRVPVDRLHAWLENHTIKPHD